ncbi:glycosyltransferase [Vibrio mimicus]|uniref:glycosyltransferase n=1 Tax=Vibrio mimicus TaxID=674 RepID=UPI0011D5F2A6|nr:glycosyltransferase [Vibrio mimicus]TXY45634.1 glycosyltransferase [Vibrio mimicus]BCN22256.1 UDP-Gal:alpha-D-GlcNAc-diphosphoundecaprenol beta-1,3-galactosyltransferase [Vibrio mimicus]BCN22565.1 UDP-Gal:alpha-D-GlcNAc-diphosphoundecaprenol beta-1,3-galactosyltransferase [Vibrio mimicus]
MVSVAVIMSVYKNDKLEFLKVAIDSVLKQSMNCHLYIYQDGPLSSDVLKYLDFISDNKAIFYYSGQFNQGLAKSLNYLIDKVISSSNYIYIARMDSDDISHPDRMKKQIDFFVTNPDVDVCGTACREFGASFALEEKHLPTTHQELLDFSIIRCPFIHPSVMFRRRVFETGIRYPTDTALTEDMALWLELLVNGFKFSNINEVLIDYRLSENTIKRRKGMDKALSEVKVRLYYMFKLKRISFKSIFLILSRFAFHLLPDSIMKFAYKNAR